MRKIYLASSWRNCIYPKVLAILREERHEVYDFRDEGFSWESVDPNWKEWSLDQFRKGICHPKATEGYNRDRIAMDWADTCVMVMPCGRSAHLEAGWFVGKRKPTAIYFDSNAKYDDADLMYRMVDRISVGRTNLLKWLDMLD